MAPGTHGAGGTRQDGGGVNGHPTAPQEEASEQSKPSKAGNNHGGETTELKATWANPPLFNWFSLRRTASTASGLQERGRIEMPTVGGAWDIPSVHQREGIATRPIYPALNSSGDPGDGTRGPWPSVAVSGQTH